MRKKLMVILAVSGILAFTAMAVMAADKGDKEKGSFDRTFFELLFSGGVMGYICMICQLSGSVAALALIIEHFVSIRMEKFVPPHLLTELENLLEEQEYEEAMDLCEAEDCFLTRVVSAGLSHMEAGVQVMENSVIDALDEEATNLHQKISWLALIGVLEPMLGLYGTVIGMMLSFAQISNATGGVDPQDLADGIFCALMTTAVGLTIAIPVMAFHALFRSRVIKSVQQVGGFSMALVDRFRTPAA